MCARARRPGARAGMRDGADAGQRECLVCFQAGKDIQIVTAENVCGPVCGYSREDLRLRSAWATSEAAKERRAAEHLAGKTARRSTLFYGGRIHALRGEHDASGRAQLLAHANATGFKIVNTCGPDPDTPLPAEVRALFRPFDVEMSDAEFCYSPLGQFEGDTDRYVPAILFGCIPVMLTATRYGGGVVPMALPMEEHPQLTWADFAVLVSTDELGQLPAILARVSARERMRMRHALARVWRRFLWTRVYGSYLGEDAREDAFESLMDVLHARAAAMPPLPPLPGERGAS